MDGHRERIAFSVATLRAPPQSSQDLGVARRQSEREQRVRSTTTCPHGSSRKRRATHLLYAVNSPAASSQLDLDLSIPRRREYFRKRFADAVRHAHRPHVLLLLDLFPSYLLVSDKDPFTLCVRKRKRGVSRRPSCGLSGSRERLRLALYGSGTRHARICAAT